ncbi:hypothetical protein G9C98_003832 [Cotesia typhae]|uniref:Fatty acyl-CoA reductase n=1 Tax=Cotesia typhae TaxID=2053667 RepID=A0A8J5UU24_9HYME|nr:hypothetical protein G9C98_003832 [Cotesia typhae]
MEDIYRRISNEDDFGEDDTEVSEIQQFFKGQTILLTGCTGFLGKCFVEKILRGCPEIKKLILIVRSRKLSAKERMKKYFQNELFDRLRRYRPNFESRVLIVEGNLEEENLEISEEDRKIITDNVTVMYHNASNVKFVTRVSESLKCNVLGTKYMIDLAKECKKLRCFCYISTAYSHSYKKKIEEVCYPSPASIKMVEDMIYADEIAKYGIPQSTVEETIKPWVNIYTFGKSIAETLVEEYAKEASFPCIIYRPSQIISTYMEPFPGWCGNWNGPALPFLGYGLGIVHLNNTNKAVQDHVPADMCANSILAITWDTVTNRKEIGKIYVFNYASSTIKPVTLREFELHAVPRGREGPSLKTLAPNFMIEVPCQFVFWVLHFFVHFIPALVADIALLAMLQKPQALAAFYKITINMPTIRYWSSSDWRITVKETEKVWDRMNHRDKILFYNDIRTIDWWISGFSYWFGLKKFVLKEPMDHARGRFRYNLMKAIWIVGIGLIVSYFAYQLFNYWLTLISPLTQFIKNEYICRM